jgi:pimeloyl-ACP methyl ester carboxylesterase
MPQTLAYALTDSPAGLAAWIVEKWRAWGDTQGDVDGRFGRDLLLTVVTLYWVNATIATSMRDYYDNRHAPEMAIGADDFVAVPTALAAFGANFIPEGVPPHEWLERLYDVRRYTPMRSGGHFAAAEEPELLARDIAAFFAELA